MSFWLLFTRKARTFRHENKELVAALILFMCVFVVFNCIMIVVEKLDPLSAFYFSFVTATTVGYGDISPKSAIGKIVSILYMLISIGALGTAIGVVTTKATDLFLKIKKGLVKVKDKIDLLIIGYPNETKVRQIVKEFRHDSRFSNATIVIVADNLDERPTWMAAEGVYFVKGLASKKEVLERANIITTERVLVLANDPFDEASDEFSSSAVIMSERLNPKAYTVAEKVREDGYLFEIAECDLVVSVSRAGELVQELQDPGAIEFSECVFSNTVEGNQYNYTMSKQAVWKDVVMDFLEKGGTVLGYRNPEVNIFCFTPTISDQVENEAIVKYIAIKPIEEI